MVESPARTQPGVTTLVTAEGVRQIEASTDLQNLVASGKFFWVDIVGIHDNARATVPSELGLAAIDLAWVQRFGQSGRMSIDRRGLRVVTWIAEHFDGALTEIHLLSSRNGLLTVWNGDAKRLNGVREHFAERAIQLGENPYHAAGVLLQLLLGTIHQTITEIDERLQGLEKQLQQNPGSFDASAMTVRLQVHSTWSAIERYSNFVRSAIVGVEDLPDVDERGAAELNDYADQVDDLGERLHERSRLAKDIVQDYSTALAQRQGEQIGRLTIVSVIFLPLSFLTGFFGMNFTWMAEHLNGPYAFLGLGIVLPSLSALLTALWFKRKGLM